MFKGEAVRAAMPSNFHVLFSTGGKQDHLIDPDVDRHADVFPSLEALVAAGYSDQGADDRDAILLPTTRIGIVANNIPQFRKAQGDATFSSLQESRDGRRAALAK